MAFGFTQALAVTGTSPQSISSGSWIVTAGSLQLAAIYWNSNTETCSVSDSVNGAWTALGSPQTGTGALAAYRFQFFYFLSSGAGGTTVTGTVTAAVDMGMAIHEYTGTSKQLDAGPAYANFTGNTTVTSDPVTTNVAGDLLFCAGVTSNAAGAAGAGFVKRLGATFGSNITEDDLDGGAAGSKTGTFSVAASGDNTIVGLVAFREGDIPPSGDTTTRRYQIRRSRMTSW